VRERVSEQVRWRDLDLDLEKERERETKSQREGLQTECTENNNQTVMGLCMKFAFFGFVSKMKRGKAAQASQQEFVSLYWHSGQRCIHIGIKVYKICA